MAVASSRSRHGSGATMYLAGHWGTAPGPSAKRPGPKEIEATLPVPHSHDNSSRSRGGMTITPGPLARGGDSETLPRAVTGSGEETVNGEVQSSLSADLPRTPDVPKPE